MHDPHLRVIRDRLADLEAQVDQSVDDAPSGSSLLVVTTVVSAYPTAVNCFFAVRELIPGGQEVEGGPATLTPAGGVFYAWNRGTQTPPQGSAVLADEVGGRWTFSYDGP
jgi:hypothetical protein